MSFQKLYSWLPVEPVRNITKERIETVRFEIGSIEWIKNKVVKTNIIFPNMEIRKKMII
jgi:hypothetical protein